MFGADLKNIDNYIKKNYNIYMKKFFKALLILVLVVASIGGTCYFFYKNLTVKKDSYALTSNFLLSGDKDEVYSDLDKIHLQLADLGDSRFVEPIKTINNMDAIASGLANYLIDAKEYDLDENKIASNLNTLIAKLNSVSNMIEEFNIKAKNVEFNKTTGANDLYKGVANYIVAYCGLIDSMNNEVNKILVNKNVDLKFAIYEIYSNSCKRIFGEFNTENSLVSVVNEGNLSFFNRTFNFVADTNLQGNHNNGFSIERNKFLSAYNKCNKSDFAYNLVAPDYNNLDFVDGMTEEEALTNTDEVLATYYFKRIFL